MIVEQRCYRFRPGGIAKFMTLYLAGPLAMQTRILGNLLGYFVTELGPLNETVHLWGYDSLDERARRRAALMAEPDWRAFLGQVMPLIEMQESRILLPAPFSPIGGNL
ncbi:MAG: NIPSNAP family protein [Pararhodobacter sp.]|nr:NIPSNAP family protein [Pararhodobacter sp.]